MEDGRELNVIEKRLKTLENRIIKDKFSHEDEEEKSKPIIQLLLESNNALSSALAGHEKISTFLSSLKKLNTVLDANFENNLMSSEIKASLLTSNYDNILNTLNLLNNFEAQRKIVFNEEVSSGAVGAEAQPNLSKIIDQQILLKDSVEAQTERIKEILFKYNSFMNNLNEYTLLIDNKLTECEIKKNVKPLE